MARLLSSGNRFSHADGEPYDIGTLRQTVACWFRPTTISVEHFLIAKWGGGGTGRSYVLQVVSDNSLLFATHNGGDGISQVQATPSPALSVGTWFHFAATRDGTTKRLYYNGKPFASAADANFVPDNNSLTFFLGAGSESQVADGAMDDACMWRDRLDGDEIKDLYEGRKPTDIRPGALVGYWPLEGYGDAEDLSGFALPLTMTGTPAAEPPNRPFAFTDSEPIERPLLRFFGGFVQVGG